MEVEKQNEGARKEDGDRADEPEATADPGHTTKRSKRPLAPPVPSTLGKRRVAARAAASSAGGSGGCPKQPRPNQTSQAEAEDQEAETHDGEAQDAEAAAQEGSQTTPFFDSRAHAGTSSSDIIKPVCCFVCALLLATAKMTRKYGKIVMCVRCFNCARALQKEAKELGPLVFKEYSQEKALKPELWKQKVLNCRATDEQRGGVLNQCLRAKYLQVFVTRLFATRQAVVPMMRWHTYREHHERIYKMEERDIVAKWNKEKADEDHDKEGEGDNLALAVEAYVQKIAGHTQALERKVITDENVANTAEEVDKSFAKAQAGLATPFNDSRLQTVVGQRAFNHMPEQKAVSLPQSFWKNAGLAPKLGVSRLAALARKQKLINQMESTKATHV